MSFNYDTDEISMAEYTIMRYANSYGFARLDMGKKYFPGRRFYETQIIHRSPKIFYVKKDL